jgi:hypothetical protein
MHDVESLPGRTHLPADIDHAVGEICAALFGSLPRRDQRRKAAEYISGLLGARGRKSVRNIAAIVGGAGTEQGLHHFISDSTWDWAPIRTALARHLARQRPPLAWVVRPMLVPKAGNHSVGVAKRFCPELGSTVNAQQAVGVWAAGEDASTPVSWRLQLPREWLADPSRRRRASIPDGVTAETPDACAIHAYLDVALCRELPRRPVVFDARETGAEAIVRRLSVGGHRFLVRVAGHVHLTMLDSGPRAAGPLPAAQIAWAAKALCRQTAWLDPTATPPVRTGLVAAVPVALPAGPALLCCVSERGENWPAELWLTNLPVTDLPTVLRLRRLLHRVDRDFADIADRVGVRDYAGRSFAGWHRHMTLASAAHAAVVLRDADQARNQAC